LPVIGILTIAAVSIATMSNQKPAEATPKLKVTNTHATTEAIETEITFDNSDLIPQATLMTAEDIAEEDFLGECEYAAAMVEAEAGNQDLLGKMYVAQVLYNRVYNSGKFPNTITENIEMLHQCRLSGSRMSNDSYKLTFSNPQIDILYRHPLICKSPVITVTYMMQI